jgi:hypothetical protein
MGWKAHAALARTAGRWTALPGFAGSAYRFADGEPIWIGEGRVVMHPRAVVFDLHACRDDRVCTGEIVPWRLAPLQFDHEAALALCDGCIALATAIRRIGDPQGFAMLLAGELPAFPLHQVAPQVVALADAIDRDDAEMAFESALPLLGLGPGLTPSGDDFVGAVLYARRLTGMSDAWTAVSQRLIDAADTRTHVIGAALFRDLAEGQSFASLHRLAVALAEAPPARAAALVDGPPAQATWLVDGLHAQAATLTDGLHAQAAAREVTAIGHSSGWDMLAGFIIGCTGSAALSMPGPHVIGGNCKEAGT